MQQTIVIERDIDQDRFITYERYKQILRLWPSLSKQQIYFMMLGVTGWRPCELARAKVQDIDFQNKCIKWRIAKARTSYRDNYIIKTHKIKWRALPKWAFDILCAYIKNNFFLMRDGYLFPSRCNKYGGHMTMESFQVELQRKRDKMYKVDPDKWGWVKDTYQEIHYPNGRKQVYYKLSLYSFRKMHTFYFAQMLLDKGITDILLHTAKHLGHTDPRTTMKYLKNLIDDKTMVDEGFKKAIDYTVEFAREMPKVDKFQRKLGEFK